MNRIRLGFCSVPNPFNRNQVFRVSLLPEDVDVIVFWTRNPRPLFPYLGELDKRGYKYYFQYTILDNPRTIDPKSPSVETAIQTFQELSQQIGCDRIIWRYDPIVLTSQTDASYHIYAYQKIANALERSTHRSVISIMDSYPKAQKRLHFLSSQGYEFLNREEREKLIELLIPKLVQTAKQSQMDIFSCAEEINLESFGVLPGKCIDDHYIQKLFGINIISKKDPSQRKECGCVISKDIGMYDSCLFECQYCYATRNFDLAHSNFVNHNPESPSMIGNLEPNIDIRSSCHNPHKITMQYKLFKDEE